MRLPVIKTKFTVMSLDNTTIKRTTKSSSSGGNKASQKKANSGRNSRKNGRNEGLGKNGKFNPKDAQRRQEEVNQCFHLLGNKTFKLFKKGQFVTSYGLALDIRVPDRLRANFTLNVPHDYPNSPVKLHYRMNDSTRDPPKEDTLQMVTKNFNIKARDMSSQRIPIISQLNYLVYRANLLATPAFKQTDQREREFYATFA